MGNCVTTGFKEQYRPICIHPHCRISSRSFILLRCSCNKVRMENALYYAEKKMEGIKRKNDAISRKLFETAIKCE